MVKKSMVLL